MAVDVQATRVILSCAAARRKKEEKRKVGRRFRAFMLSPGSWVFPSSFRGTVSHTEEGLYKHRREELFFAELFFLLLHIIMVDDENFGIYDRKRLTPFGSVISL
jgi:hypothetical protein